MPKIPDDSIVGSPTEQHMQECFEVLKKRLRHLRDKMLFKADFGPDDFATLEASVENFANAVGRYVQDDVFKIDE